MSYQRQLNNSTEIFSGALWSQRHQWRKTMKLLPANSCLLAVNPKNEKQTQILRKIAQSFRDHGRPVLIWLSPTQSNT